MDFGCDLDLHTGSRWFPVAAPIPYPVAPAPERKQARTFVWERPLPETLTGRVDRALGGLFGSYCWVFGFQPTDELRHAVVSGLLGREVTTWRDRSEEYPDGLLDTERRDCVTMLEAIVRSVDHGFLDYLKSHNRRLGTYAELRTAACGLLLNQGAPYYPGGDGPAMFAALCHALEEHMDGCDGEHCTLLAAIKAQADAQRAAA